MAFPATTDIASERGLARKARLLRSSPLFSPRTGLDPLSEKRLLFLAIAGVKPVSAGASSHWIMTERGGHAAADDPAEVAALLRRLGLAYELEVRDTAVMAYVSLERAYPDTFLAARNDHRVAGRLFGYPMTAVEAFATGELMSVDDQRAAEQALGVPVLSTFRLSRTDTAAEFEVMRQWWRVLERYDLCGPRGGAVPPG